MKVKINTTEKTIELQEEVTYAELEDFVLNLVDDISKWKIVPFVTTVVKEVEKGGFYPFTVPSIDPIPCPYQPTPPGLIMPHITSIWPTSCQGNPLQVKETNNGDLSDKS